MVQVVEQTKEQKIKMYMNLPKRKLAEMLYNCNVIIESHQPEYKIAPLDTVGKRKYHK